MDVVLGTGDGQLAQDVAEAIGQLRTARAVVTMNLAGATSAQLDARVCSLIAANIEVGLDCLHPRESVRNCRPR